MTTDPAVIAALDGATVAQLREDAAHAIECASLCGEGDARRYTFFRRLAAIALAVARIADTSDARIEQAGRADYLILDIPMPETHTMSYGGCDLIPALAALLREGQ